MKLEQQVTSLEISKKLKELGVKQESLFYWRKGVPAMDKKSGYCELHCLGKLRKGGDVSAFTVAELGELISKPDTSLYSRRQFTLNWECSITNSKLFVADTEADARGKMLIYLIENKLVP